MARRLGPEERALWRKVIASVRPLDGSSTKFADVEPPSVAPQTPRPRAAPPAPRPIAPKPAKPGTTLDGTWDRRLRNGAVRPDLVVDLHGHNLADAYDLLDSRLHEAIQAGSRIILLITGKPPTGEPPIARGRIRAAMGDWLGASRHARHIAAVRAAHPRHGGAGAMYIILRRKQ